MKQAIIVSGTSNALFSEMTKQYLISNNFFEQISTIQLLENDVVAFAPTSRSGTKDYIIIWDTDMRLEDIDGFVSANNKYEDNRWYIIFQKRVDIHIILDLVRKNPGFHFIGSDSELEIFNLLLSGKKQDTKIQMSYDLQQQLIHSFLNNPDESYNKKLNEFNNMEYKILELACNGYSLEETANNLNLSRNTIAAYRSKMLKKARVRSMIELIAKTRQ